MIQILVVSDSYNHFDKPIQEYIKRLGKNTKIIKIKPEKNWEINTIIKKETDKIIDFLEKEKWFVIWLDNLGDSLDTIELSNFISKTLTRQSKITFLIWWSYWYDKNLLEKYIHKKISFGKITIPHSLAFLVLLEQLFRIKSIENNTGYHH